MSEQKPPAHPVAAPKPTPDLWDNETLGTGQGDPRDWDPEPDVRGLP